MESVLSIRSRIAPLAWRVRWHRGIYWSTRCLQFGLLATLPFLLLKSLLAGPLTVWVLGLAFIGAGGGLVYGLSRPVPLSDLARLTEERLHLQDRLSTALEYYDRQEHSPFALALYRDAFRTLPVLNGKNVLPLRLPPQWWSLLPTALVVLLLSIAPPLPLHRLGVTLPQVGPHRTTSTGPERLDNQGQPPTTVEAPPMRHRRWKAGTPPSSPVLREKDVPFKDTPLSRSGSDFSSFLQGGDERVRLLGRSQFIPDLKGGEVQSPYQVVVQEMQELAGRRGAGYLSPEEVKRLLSAIERMGKSGDFPGPVASARELEGLTPRGAQEALEGALERLRDQEEARLQRSEVTQKPGPGSRAGEGSREGEEAGKEQAPRREVFGPLAGRGRSNLLRQEPTPRVETSLRDAGLKGQQRAGRSTMIDTDILSKAAGGKPTVSQGEVLARYRQIAEESLNREMIPPDYREQVKAYFDSLLSPMGRGANE